jgi:hypothetical protein
VVLGEGDHICAFYRGSQERDALLRSYLGAGLGAGERCLCVVDSIDPEHVLGLLDGSGQPSVWGGQLTVTSSDRAYLREGRFEPAAMIRFWDELVGASAGGGYRMTRAVGEMTWALRGAPGVERLVSYESELNRFLPLYPQVILCLYDLDRFGAETVVDLMKTHPKLLINGMLLENPYYLDPDEFLARLNA